jgi:hypothetical protein
MKNNWTITHNDNGHNNVMMINGIPIKMGKKFKGRLTIDEDGSVQLTRDTPSSSIEDDAKHRASSQNPTEDQSAKQPVEKDKENVPQTDLKNDKGAEEPMKENGEQKQDSPAKEKDGSKDRPTSDKDILTDRPSDSEKATPLECDQENILKAKIGELYKGENCKWRVLNRESVKSNFTVQND